jgi:hypothetical protein
MKNAKPVILAVILAAVTGIGLVFCVVALPLVVQRCRESARRDECERNLKQLGEALKQYSNRGSHSPATTTDRKNGLAFDTYSGYFVSNKFEPDAAESFAVIGSQSQFDEIFGAAVVMGDKSRRLPKNAFDSRIVLAVIKRGRAIWKFTVDDVTVNDNVVTLRYSATSRKGESASFACPLIVSIPKIEHAEVQFIENGNPVKKTGGKT